MRLTFVLIGLAMSGGFGILAFLAFRRAYRMTSTWHRAIGAIVGFTEHSRKGRTSYIPRVEFTIPTGELVTFSASFGSSWRSRVGRSVRVLYSPDDPTKADIASFMNLWFLPGFLSIFVGGFAFLSVAEIMKALTQK